MIIPVKEGESIDKALKKFKKKFERTQTMRQLRKRQALRSHLSPGERDDPRCVQADLADGGTIGRSFDRWKAKGPLRTFRLLCVYVAA